MRKMVMIGDLPRDIREDLYNLHAVFNDPEAREPAFYRRRVPVVQADLTSIPDYALYRKMTEEECEEYREVMAQDPLSKLLIVADEQLLDGMHRVTASVRAGETVLQAVDMTGLIDTKQSGSICPIAIIRANEPQTALPSP